VGALPLQFAVEFAFGPAQLARQPLEGFLLVDSILGLEAGDAVGNPEGRAGRGLAFGNGSRTSLDQQGELAANAIAASQLAARISRATARTIATSVESK